jgi:hypothetical protein
MSLGLVLRHDIHTVRCGRMNFKTIRPLCVVIELLFTANRKWITDDQTAHRVPPVVRRPLAPF